jgi:hypothetical protein
MTSLPRERPSWSASFGMIHVGHGSRELPMVVFILWPGSRIHFFEVMKQPRWEDFNLTPLKGNRFEYFGNGKDLIWCLGLIDDENKQLDFNDESVKDSLLKISDLYICIELYLELVFTFNL